MFKVKNYNLKEYLVILILSFKLAGLILAMELYTRLTLKNYKAGPTKLWASSSLALILLPQIFYPSIRTSSLE